MNHPNLSIVRSRGFAALLLIAALVLVGAPAFAQVSCEEGDRWAEANQDALPQTVADFSEVPSDYRAAAFHALATEDKTRLWTEHIDQMIADRDDLTEQHVADLRASTDLFENPEARVDEKDIVRMALGSFIVRLAGERSPDQLVAPAAIPHCNCDTSHVGCVRAFCIPNQNCSPYACGGLWAY